MHIYIYTICIYTYIQYAYIHIYNMHIYIYNMHIYIYRLGDFLVGSWHCLASWSSGSQICRTGRHPSAFPRHSMKHPTFGVPNFGYQVWPIVSRGVFEVWCVWERFFLNFYAVSQLFQRVYCPLNFSQSSCWLCLISRVRCLASTDLWDKHHQKTRQSSVTLGKIWATWGSNSIIGDELISD